MCMWELFTELGSQKCEKHHCILLYSCDARSRVAVIS